jgi:hypothetical protein
MEDRVEALGGSLEFDGITLGGSIPLGVHPPPLAEDRVGAQFSR